jgi:hypothetical protein
MVGSMSAKTQRWKNAEKQLAETYQEFKIDAERVSRAGDYSVSDFDVRIKDQEWVKSDSKYSQEKWKETRLLEAAEDRYCKVPGDTMIIATKGYRQTGMTAIIGLRFFAMLLSYWIGAGTKEELWSIYMKDKKDE